MTEENYMERAIELAKRGRGYVNPNPLVGAVIVKDGRIIGEGYHAKYGDLHAERDALKNVTESPEGATIYVTLEPCCHHGKQPPCTDAIIESGIKRVVIGSADPNPVVNGHGVKILRDAGIEVIEGFMKKECDALNPVFMHYITTGRPYVMMKYAMTADGKIAAKTGASRYVSGEESRYEVQKLRHELKGIMVGIGTVLMDDPKLTCRIEGGINPVRIVCDSRLRTPSVSYIAETASEIPTIILSAVRELKTGEITEEDVKTSGSETAIRGERLLQKGVRIFNYPLKDEARVDLHEAMKALGKAGIDGILLEGGGTLNESMLREGLVQEIRMFLSPKIFGGKAKTPVEGIGVEDPKDAQLFTWKDVQIVGKDLMVTAVPQEGDTCLQES
ncbi:diaminohydroxyphosphoribosylaminopyrimidine deaminase [Lachnospiraceae bacterium]|nr:diaminohydroxyphosphoribosylaminopyrimidine deaminase [Lachnospiraceae bacterium]